MEYPDHLLPKPNYRYISDIRKVGNRNILRFYEGPIETFIDEITGKPLTKCVCLRSAGLMDLSTSLHGTFQISDNSFKIIGNRKKFLTEELWPEGEVIDLPPNENEFLLREEITNYCFSIEEINGFKIPFNIAGEEGSFNATLLVKHTPCRANYWHFSIRVFNEKNEDLYQLNIGRSKPYGRDSQILKSVKKVIANLVLLEIPECESVDFKVYMDEEE